MTGIQLSPLIALRLLYVAIGFGFIGIVLLLWGALRKPQTNGEMLTIVLDALIKQVKEIGYNFSLDIMEGLSSPDNVYYVSKPGLFEAQGKVDTKRNGIFGQLERFELEVEKAPLFERLSQRLKKAKIWESYEAWKNAWIESWNLVHSDKKWNLGDDKDPNNIKVNNLGICYDKLMKELVNYREDIPQKSEG